MNKTFQINEIARLEALRQYNILDTACEEVYDDLALIAAKICNTPIGAVSLVDSSRQWFKSSYGLNFKETSRDDAFCSYAISEHDLFIIEDAIGDKRFVNNPLVTGKPGIRFYAGAQLVTKEGYALGTLCVIDILPKTLTTDQKEALQVLARVVMTQLEMRRNAAHLVEVNSRLAKEIDELKTK